MFLGRRKQARVVSALVMAMASEPQEVFGAATLGHQHGKSSQNTLPLANAAGIQWAEKKQKAAQRILLSLDNLGPHKCSARHCAPPGGVFLIERRTATKALRACSKSF
jgi:hypothetical protein